MIVAAIALGALPARPIILRVPAPDSAQGPLRRFDTLLFAMIALLAGFTVLVAVAPMLQFGVPAPALDLAINVAAALVAIAVAALAWPRYGEGGDAAALFQTAAFLGLAAVNVLSVGIVLAGRDVEVGFSATQPTQAPVYSQLISRFVTAVLLGLGALPLAARVGVIASTRRWVALLPAALLVAVTLFAIASRDRLPALLSAEAMRAIATAAAHPSGLPGNNSALFLLQSAVALLFAVDAWLYRRRYAGTGEAMDAYLSLALVAAAFSQLHFAFYPGAYTSVVATGDLLRLVFQAMLLLGISAEARSQMRALRSANADLRLLREAELARTTLEERARLAREVHDGLAQDLWFAKLKQSRLRQLADLPDEARELTEQVETAIDSALAEARQAVMAMRAQDDEAPFREVLARYVEDFGERFGLRTEFTADGDLEGPSPRAQAELLRIVQEALNNVRKHADATVVRVRAGRQDGRLGLVVADNGVGFDPASTNGRGFGLRSMRERAELVGARVDVESQPHGGTRVSVEVPLEGRRT